MSTTTFVEATSDDPFVRELHRKAMRLLNDPSLDRRQREFHMRRLQSSLLEHQAEQDAKKARLLAKKASREQVARENRNHRCADSSQVVARRREMRVGAVEQVEAAAQATPAATVGSESRVSGRNRPVLRLKRA